MTRWILRWTLVGLLTTVAGCASNGSGASPLGGGACPNAQLDDIWLNKRLGCLTVGQDVSATVRTAPGARADRAFVVSQQTLANGFTNVLGSSNKRYFSHLVCVHDAPSDFTSPSSSVPFATDLVVAFRVMSLQPAEVDSPERSRASTPMPSAP
jgi:hypothetical protein